MQPNKVNFKHYVPNAAVMTVEKTLLNGKANKHTVSFEISRAMDDPNGSGKVFDHENKWALQLHPFNELPQLLAVLMTYTARCQFSYHSATKNHSLAVEWLPKEEKLKFTFLFAGQNRFIEMPRAKVFELMVFCSDVMILSLKGNQTLTQGQHISLSDVETYISRAFRPFRS